MAKIKLEVGKTYRDLSCNETFKVLFVDTDQNKIVIDIIEGDIEGYALIDESDREYYPEEVFDSLMGKVPFNLNFFMSLSKYEEVKD